MNQRHHKVIVHGHATLGITAMELASNHSFPRHTHDEYGIGVILSGAQRSWSGVGPVESLPGDVITVNPGEVHDGHPISGAARRWRIMYFDPKTLAHQLAPDAIKQLEFASPNLRDARLGQRVNLLFSRLTRTASVLAVEEILVQLVRRLASENRPGYEERKYSTTVARARERIDDDPAGQINLGELATLSGVSRYQILRAFARELGVTPYAYVIQCRVRLARQLLLQGATLADAAQRAGFADQSHLTRAFGRQIGISPGQYLRIHSPKASGA